MRHDVREACKLFIDNDIKTIAVSFIWSVLNPSHEIRAAQIVKEMMPDADYYYWQRTVSTNKRIHKNLNSYYKCLLIPHLKKICFCY